MIGFDFGTTNSGMAQYDGEKLRVLPLGGLQTIDESVIRTALYIDKGFGIAGGQLAVDRYIGENMGRPICLRKVHVGEIEQLFSDVPFFIKDVFAYVDIFSPGRFFESFKGALPSKLYAGTVVNNFFFLLEDIIATYMIYLKERAEKLVQQPLPHVVLGRPVHFAGVNEEEESEIARQRLGQAARLAGFEEIYFQYEPVAAALNYAHQNRVEQTIFVFDFGGGTLDTTVMSIQGVDEFEILGLNGIGVGGDTFDQRILMHVLPRNFGADVALEHGIPITYYNALMSIQHTLELAQQDKLDRLAQVISYARDKRPFQAFLEFIENNYILRAFNEARRVKRLLSFRESATYVLHGKEHLHITDTITRHEFEGLISNETQLVRKCIEDTLLIAGVHASSIDAVVYTGGSSQVPIFKRLLGSMFGTAKLVPTSTFSGVSSGLAISSYLLQQGVIELNMLDWTKAQPSNTTTSQTRVSHIDINQIHVYIQEQLSLENTEDQQLRLLILSSQKAYLVTTEWQAAETILPKDSLLPGSRNHSRSIQPCVVAPHQELLSANTRGEFDLLSVSGLILAQKINEEAVMRYLRLEDLDGTCYITPWPMDPSSDYLLHVTSQGYVRAIQQEHFANKLGLEKRVTLSSYRKGITSYLVPSNLTGTLIMITSQGRYITFPANIVDKAQLTMGLTVPEGDRLICCLPFQEPTLLLALTTEAEAVLIPTDLLLQSSKMGGQGHKLITRIAPLALVMITPSPEAALYGITADKEVIRLDLSGVAATARLPIHQKDLIQLLEPGKTMCAVVKL
ncbi:MAG: Hsp70 family protein [Anaerolineae bacterium]|nr:Hsp70 family protein [Anaerolineae bacterium]